MIFAEYQKSPRPRARARARCRPPEGGSRDRFCAGTGSRNWSAPHRGGGCGGCTTAARYLHHLHHLYLLSTIHDFISREIQFINEIPVVFEARVRASDEQQQQQETKYVCPVLGLTPPPPISAPCLAAAILAGDWPMHWSIDQEKLSIAS